MSIGLPESSVRGFCIAWAGFAEDGSAAVASVCRGVCCACVNCSVRLVKTDVVLESPFTAEGARKSRCRGGHVAAEVALLNARDVEYRVFGGLTADLVRSLFAARRHDAHTAKEDAMTGESRVEAALDVWTFTGLS